MNYRIIPILLLSITTISLVHSEDNYANLKKFNECLFLYTEGGQYNITFNNGDHPERGGILPIAHAVEEDSKSSCFSENNPNATFAIKFSDGMDNNFMESMLFEFHMRKTHDFWEVHDIVLTINPTGPWPADIPKVVRLLPDDLYASNGFSYSCNNLTLSKRPSRENKETDNNVRYSISFSRFQLQPFKVDGRIFAQSYDCSVWLTLPMIMGFLLVLFITLTVIIVIYLMVELGAQTKDLKFSKQGGMLMNQAQLESTKN